MKHRKTSGYIQLFIVPTRYIYITHSRTVTQRSFIIQTYTRGGGGVGGDLLAIGDFNYVHMTNNLTKWTTVDIK